MAKRFIDSNLFQKDWFLELEPKYQILYVYMFTHCDVAGVFDPNLKTLSKLFNTEYNEEETLFNFKNQLVRVRDKWLLTGFLKHQYGLKISPKMIKPIEKALDKIGLTLENLDRVSIEYRYSIDTPKEKEIDIEKEIDNKEGVIGETNLPEEPQDSVESTKKYFDLHYHQMLPPEFIDSWRKYVDHQSETGAKIHQHNVMSHLKAFKECWQSGISPPELLEAFQQSSHKGLYWISKNLIKVKENEKSNINSGSNFKSGNRKPIGEFDITGDNEYHYETFEQK
ncbi:MAG: hypothetical protein KGZ42_07330 [Melioribacter sp.]|nr:hypothetical protein [Melioribacter sp.]